jgi:hypothetical protein
VYRKRRPSIVQAKPASPAAVNGARCAVALVGQRRSSTSSTLSIEKRAPQVSARPSPSARVSTTYPSPIETVDRSDEASRA